MLSRLRPSARHPLPPSSEPVSRRPLAAPPALRSGGLFLVLLAAFSFACDHGLEPPPPQQTGVIRALITYEGHPESWPDPSELVDLRFVALRFVPRDTADLLQLTRLAFSGELRRYVAADTAVLDDVPAGAYVYSGVAQRYSQNLFDWRPVGLYEDNDGVFHVRPDETTEVSVRVDFRNPPLFPPPAP